LDSVGAGLLDWKGDSDDSVAVLGGGLGRAVDDFLDWNGERDESVAVRGGGLGREVEEPSD